MNATVVPLHRPRRESYDSQTRNNVSTFFDKSYGVQWQILASDAPRRITSQLLNDIQHVQEEFKNDYLEESQINYLVFSSEIPGVFSLGGDLGFFAKCAVNKDTQSLRNYAHKAVGIAYERYTNFNLPVTTVSLVKGAAIGGGFEAALAANYLIAEQQATFSFPETRFGLFPGMGAFTFLRQRIQSRQAEEIIYSGKTYSADELYTLGVIDHVCQEGEGDAATLQFIRKRHQQHQGIQAMREMVQKFSPVDRNELYTIVDHWVDQVMRLDSKQLRMIEALSKTSENFIDKLQQY